MKKTYRVSKSNRGELMTVGGFHCKTIVYTVFISVTERNEVLTTWLMLCHVNDTVNLSTKIGYKPKRMHTFILSCSHQSPYVYCNMKHAVCGTIDYCRCRTVFYSYTTLFIHANLEQGCIGT